MKTELFTKIEENLKPVWNSLSPEERESVSETAMDFQAHEKAKHDDNYDPGSSPYEMDPERWLQDCLMYHFRMVVTMGMRLKKFRSLTPREQTLEAMFS